MSLGAEFGASFNTYNYASALSQVLQGTYVSINGKDYILLQIHGGCDVRGGYTDAKLFRLSDLTEGYMPLEDVVGVVIKPDKRDKVTTPIFDEPSAPEPIWISNSYDGYRLTDENGAGVEIGVEDTVELFLAECR